MGFYFWLKIVFIPMIHLLLCGIIEILNCDFFGSIHFCTVFPLPPFISMHIFVLVNNVSHVLCFIGINRLSYTI